MTTFAIPMRCLLWACLLVLTAPAEANAYIDLGTGSYMLQLFTAGVFGASFAVKLFWRNIKTFFRGLISRDQK